METDQFGKKFLFITPHTIPETSGSGINAFRFARYINQEGGNALLLTLNRNFKFKDKENIDGVPVIRIPYVNKGNFCKMISLPIIFLYYFLYIIKHDTILIYGGRLIGFQLIPFIGKLFGKKIIFRSTLMGVDDPDSLFGTKNKLIQKINRISLSKVDCYFSINRNFSDQYRKYFSDRSKLYEIPQGVDTTRFFPYDTQKKQEIRAYLGLPSEGLLILSVGLVIKRKGFDRIIEQLATLRMDYCLISLGEYEAIKGQLHNKYAEEMEQLYDRANYLLKKRVIFRGFINHLEEYFRCCDVFILNSSQEGFPNVILEAMASGIPIIMKNIKGIGGFVIKNGYNSLVFSNDNDIPVLLQRLFENPELARQIAANAFNDIINHYSFAHVFTGINRALTMEDKKAIS
jgi:glycosyltransferase involved in cell wall biosynthesis